MGLRVVRAAWAGHDTVHQQPSAVVVPNGRWVHRLRGCRRGPLSRHHRCVQLGRESAAGSTAVHGAVCMTRSPVVDGTDEGRVYAWGSCAHGQLGLGIERSTNVPTAVFELRQAFVAMVWAGREHSLALLGESHALSRAGLSPPPPLLARPLPRHRCHVFMRPLWRQVTGLSWHGDATLTGS